MDLAQRLAAGPTLAYAESKRLISASLDAVLEEEAKAQARCGVTADHHDAVMAFRAKQRPAFHGR
jgi:2-(1,2-epoxy-1,2-dihydrophenyl)acetyl-CoA isomerase